MVEHEVTSRTFEKSGYTVVRGAVEKSLLKILSRYFEFAIRRNQLDLAEDGSSWECYSDPLSESMLVHLKPLVQRTTGLGLHPTYSFTRIYLPGASLPEHTDRPECEISASLTVDYRSTKLWPLILRLDGRKLPVYLDCGDMLIYRGEIPHSRDALDGSFWTQCFLHYVAKDGRHSERIFDHRIALGLPHSHRVMAEVRRRVEG